MEHCSWQAGYQQQNGTQLLIDRYVQAVQHEADTDSDTLLRNVMGPIRAHVAGMETDILKTAGKLGLEVCDSLQDALYIQKHALPLALDSAVSAAQKAWSRYALIKSKADMQSRAKQALDLRAARRCDTLLGLVGKPSFVTIAY